MCRGCIGNVITNDLLYSSPHRFEYKPSRRNLMRHAAAGIAASALLRGTSAVAADSGADVIFRNGTIIPMAGSRQDLDALAIGGGRILGLGTEADVMGLKSASTKIVDLAGRTVLPGFVDPHHHTSMAAIFAELLTDVGYTKYATRAALLDALKALSDKTPPGQWVLVYNFDNLLQGGDLSMSELDAISNDRPIFVWYTNAHDAVANSLAFRLAQIPDDVGILPGGGHFGRGPDGKFNGLIYEEQALLKFVAIALPKITPELMARSITDYTKALAAVGNTTAHEPGTIQPAWVDGLANLSNSLSCRLSASLMVDALKGGDAYRALGIGAKATHFPNSRFSLYGIKIVGDGSNQTETGAQTKPYLNSSNKGSTNFSADELRTMVAAVKAAGWPVLIHCNGDATIDAALDAIEAAYGSNPASGINRIEHSTMARPDQLTRMKKLGVEPSFLMNHVFLYGAAYRDQLFGSERAAFMDPAGDCVRMQLPFTLHTDAPCSPIGPLRLIQAAVTRQCDVDKSVIGADQAISVGQALKATTIDAARQIGLADRIGTLEQGKEADLVILEDNPLKVDPSKIMAIKVSETWLAGAKQFG